MMRGLVFGGILALLATGCDVLSDISGEFQSPATVKVLAEGKMGEFLKEACVRLSIKKEEREVRSLSDCKKASYSFQVDLPEGEYELVAQGVESDIPYLEGSLPAVIRRGQEVEIRLDRKKASVVVEAYGFNTSQEAILEVWFLEKELVGGVSYYRGEEPPEGLEGRVLIAREGLKPKGHQAELSVPTGLDVAFLVRQGDAKGVDRLDIREDAQKVSVSCEAGCPAQTPPEGGTPE